VEETIKPKMSMRPSTIRGASFGDDDGGGIPEKPQEPVYNFIKPNRSMRPSTTRGASFGADDEVGVPEKPHVPVHNSIKTNRGMRPSTTRGTSFGDDESGGVPEKPQEPVYNFIKAKKSMRPSTTRGASFGDDDSGGVPEKPQEPDLRPSAIRGASVKSRVAELDSENKSAVDLEKSRKCKECYKWYSRMGHPSRADMKRRVADMPESCNMTVADVDELPWMMGGKMLNVIEMNKLYLQ
jgi:hypothetical protein